MQQSNLNHSTAEEWRPIAGYEGRYEISNHGRIKSLAREVFIGRGHRLFLTEKIMRSFLHYRGYIVVWLRQPGSNKKFFVHRLVAEAFLPNPERKPVVNHKDRNKANCHISNLEWMTFSENTLHYYATELDEGVPF